MNVVDLLDSLASWPTLLLAVLIYGFMPGFLLRLIVLAYERDDPRREELVAELYAVERIKRPFWVAEQLETALFDGLGPRLRWAATGRIILRWRLGNGVKQNRRYPDTFGIPSDDEKADIVPGIAVKLMFQQSDGWGERMWVEVDTIGRRYLTGYLVNMPVGGFPRLHPGRRIRFRRDHIIDIAWDYEPGAIDDDCDARAVCGACGGIDPPEATEVSDHGPDCGCQVTGSRPSPAP